MSMSMSLGAVMVGTASLLLSFTMSTDAAYCHGHPSPDASPNINPIYVPDKENPSGTLITSNENGAVYRVGEGDDAITVLHVYGDDPYVNGHTQGR